MGCWPRVSTGVLSEKIHAKCGAPTLVDPAPSVRWLVRDPFSYYPMGNVFACNIMQTVKPRELSISYSASVELSMWERPDRNLDNVLVNIYTACVLAIYLPLSRHVAKKHGYRMLTVNFTVLDWVHIPTRGGIGIKFCYNMKCAGYDIWIPPPHRASMRRRALGPFYKASAQAKQTKSSIE